MRHTRTRRRWQHVFGLVLILALGLAPVLYPVGVFADAGNETPEPIVTPTPTTAPVQYRMALTDLNLRTAPDETSDVLTVVPENTIVVFLGQTSGMYAEIEYNGVSGWVVAQYLLEGVDGSEVPTVGVTVTPTATTAPVLYRTTLAELNLRTAPDANADILTVIPQGAVVTYLDQMNGIYAQVTYNNATGWVVAEYLSETGETPTATAGVTETTTPGTVEPTGTATEVPSPTGTVEPTGTVATSTPETVTPTETPAITETVVTNPERVLTESVNLRAQPNANAEIITILDKGLTVNLTGRTSGLYSEVTAGSSTGWVATQYLAEPGAVTPTSTAGPTGTATTVTPTGTATTPAATETPATTTPTTTAAPTTGPTQAPTIPAGNSLIIWPVKGGEWEISQGYHGSSHQNESSLWQYADSFDIVRNDAETAGQPVYSPVNGTIRWFDPSTGGISIDMGDGYAFALFHMDVDPSLVVGQTLTQGQYIGTIAQPGGGGNGGFPHLHLTVWATDDGGNWSRTAVPFVGQLAISGVEFPDTGASYEHTGYTFNP
ncbi:MAG: SH3 domain-containing protein [Thermomicrobiales bacterium]